MDETRTACLLAILFLIPQAAVQAQRPLTGPGFVPRHERVATSVLRRRTAAKSTYGGSPVVGSTSEAQPLSDLAPPPPPPLANSHNTTVTTPIAAPSVDSEYPIMMDSEGHTGSIVVESPEYIPEGMAMEYQTGMPCEAGTCGGCTRCRSPSCWIDTFSVNLGVAAFKNAINNGRSGSFGFQQGFNWGSPCVFRPLGMNTQIGLRAVQSEFGGTQFDGGGNSDDYRSQFFLTGGFFRRVHCGWQGGIVFDYLRDNWIDRSDLGQLRGELSWAATNGSSIGLWATSSVSDALGRSLSESSASQEFETHEVLTLFYRAQSNQHRLGQWRVFAGLTGESDGFVGSDFKVPLAGTWSLEPEFSYLIPDESTSEGGPTLEGWNVAFNLVWYPGRAVRGINYMQLPMFDVAGNGSMISRRLR